MIFTITNTKPNKLIIEFFIGALDGYIRPIVFR